jgi:hypothetical protein
MLKIVINLTQVIPEKWQPMCPESAVDDFNKKTIKTTTEQRSYWYLNIQKRLAVF